MAMPAAALAAMKTDANMSCGTWAGIKKVKKCTIGSACRAVRLKIEISEAAAGEKMRKIHNSVGS